MMENVVALSTRTHDKIYFMMKNEKSCVNNSAKNNTTQIYKKKFSVRNFKIFIFISVMIC